MPNDINHLSADDLESVTHAAATRIWSGSEYAGELGSKPQHWEFKLYAGDRVLVSAPFNFTGTFLNEGLNQVGPVLDHLGLGYNRPWASTLAPHHYEVAIWPLLSDRHG